MKIIWYRVSSRCSDKPTDGYDEYYNRPIHLIRESDKQCMACLTSKVHARDWAKEYQERLGKDWRVKDIATLQKSSDDALNHLNRFFSGLNK